jgi:hypothetical protein
MSTRIVPLKEYPGFYYGKLAPFAWGVFVLDASASTPRDSESAYTQVGPLYASVRFLMDDLPRLVALYGKSSKTTSERL